MRLISNYGEQNHLSWPFYNFSYFFFRQAFISFNNIKNDEIGLIGGEIYHSVLMKLATDGRTKQPLAKTKQIIKKNKYYNENSTNKSELDLNLIK